MTSRTPPQRGSENQSSGSPGPSRPHGWRSLVPFLVSFALVVWLILRISAEKLFQEASILPWQTLLPATALLVLGLYFWDALCLRTIYEVKNQRLRYLQSLHVRGTSYLVGAINYELSQGMIAWSMSRLQHTSFLSMLSRSVLLACHDIFVLLAAGLIGSLLSTNPGIATARTVCIVGVLSYLAAALLISLVPARFRERFRQTRWGAWLESWSWARSFRLVLLRIGYFALLVGYGALALQICRIHVGPMVVLSTIPLVLLADGLPSISGLGTREAALLLLLSPTIDPQHNPDPAARLVAMSLVWSMGIVIGRLVIGLGHLWLPRLLGGKCGPRDGPQR